MSEQQVVADETLQTRIQLVFDDETYTTTVERLHKLKSDYFDTLLASDGFKMPQSIRLEGIQVRDFLRATCQMTFAMVAKTIHESESDTVSNHCSYLIVADRLGLRISQDLTIKFLMKYIDDLPITIIELMMRHASSSQLDLFRPHIVAKLICEDSLDPSLAKLIFITNNGAGQTSRMKLVDNVMNHPKCTPRIAHFIYDPAFFDVTDFMKFIKRGLISPMAGMKSCLYNNSRYGNRGGFRVTSQSDEPLEMNIRMIAPDEMIVSCYEIHIDGKLVHTFKTKEETHEYVRVISPKVRLQVFTCV